MEIEIGDYVRTIDGFVGIFDRYSKRPDTSIYKSPFNCFIKLQNRKTPLQCHRDYIVKHSKIISEIVEVGDYVNGLEVEQVLKVREFKGFRGSKKFAFTHIKFSIPGGMIEDKEIRTILTKEQYLANCYKVGGE